MKKKCYLAILLIFVMACRKPYNPPVIASPGSYLVVEGVINSGSDSTIIKLSKTVSLSTSNTTNPVLGAIVSVESNGNLVYPLTETTNGNYVSPGLNLNKAQTYRLSIKTPNNEQYFSDFVPVNITPPIDSIGFNILNIPAPGIQIYANTHDATNTIKYYRWDYAETWEFHADYFSGWEVSGDTLRQRPVADEIYYCYKSDSSSNVILGSSAKLQQDVLYQSPIAFIPSTSEKIETEYSILLKEYAITADAYNFWTNLKTNTEQLGSIFDAEPSQVNGNIHCITNPSEPVIGYISASTVTSKRIFISEYQLPKWTPIYPYACEIEPEEIGTYAALFYGHPPVEIPLTQGGTTFAYYTCVNCRIRGSKTPPSFWP
jgi:hypothetical protein